MSQKDHRKYQSSVKPDFCHGKKDEFMPMAVTLCRETAMDTANEVVVAALSAKTAMQY